MSARHAAAAAGVLQVKAWPCQPLDAAIKWLKSQPSEWVVADFGCGEARLAASIQQVNVQSVQETRTVEETRSGWKTRSVQETRNQKPVCVCLA